MIYSNYFFFGDQNNIWMLNRTNGDQPGSQLEWFQHNSANNTWAEGSSSFADTSKLLMCSHVFAGGDGIIYAVKANNKVGGDSLGDNVIRNGSLLRFQFNSANRTLSDHTKIGVGWDVFLNVFSAGGGRIYAVDLDGKLCWYKHDLSTNQFISGCPRVVGSAGWNNFTHVFYGGEDDQGVVIYAIDAQGRLWWYKHLAPQTGGTEWMGPLQIASGPEWRKCPGAFARTQGSGASRVAVIYRVSLDGKLYYHTLTDCMDRSIGVAPLSAAQDTNGIGFEPNSFVNGNLDASLSYDAGSVTVTTQSIDAGSATTQSIGAGSGADPNTPFPDRWIPIGAERYRPPVNLTQQGFSLDAVDVPAYYIQGICWPPSAAPGQTIDFRVNAAASFDLSFVRLNSGIPQSAGDTKGPSFSVMSEIPTATYPRRITEVAVDSFSRGCGHWPVTKSIVIPSTWSSGVYGAKCVMGSSTFIIPFVVKPAQPSGRIALLTNLFTWHAYNDWGATSNYTNNSPVRLSLERPYTGSSSSLQITDPFDSYISDHLLRAEMWPLKWLQDNYSGVDVYTDLDLHDGSLDLSRYKALVLTTHPEYWTDQMFDATRSFLAGGGAMIHLGGNSIYRRCVYEPATRTLRFCQDSNLQIASPVDAHDGWQFTNLDPATRFELDLLGMGSEWASQGCSGGDPRYPVPATTPAIQRVSYVIRADKAGHWALAGVQNSTIGALGYNQFTTWINTDNGNKEAWVTGGAVGVETNWSPKELRYVLYPALTPLPNTEILAKQGSCLALVEGQMRGAEMITCNDRSGNGFIFSVGSVGFGGSLVKDNDLQRIVRNVIGTFLPQHFISSTDVP